MGWLRKRLGEPSTHRGLMALVGAVSVYTGTSPEMVLTFLGGALGLYETVRKEFD